MSSVEPPRWTPEELDRERARALAAFVEAWGSEGTKRYEATVHEFASPLRQLFEKSDNLRSLSGQTFAENPLLLGPARFLVAPPVSADDLKTLTGGNLGSRSAHADRAERAARIIRSAWDPVRFPWLAAGRSPTAQEKRTAILWTASIWAIESMRTFQRNSSAKNQERSVKSALGAAGFEHTLIRHIRALEDLERECYADECRFGDNKCDVPVRLRDGRLLAIECKVSNSTINSKKRLNNDVGAKAANWRQTYGAQVITAAVLSGVYSLGNLLTAQENQGITIFWGHDLERLVAFARMSAP